MHGCSMSCGLSCDLSCDLQDEKSLHDLLDDLRRSGGLGLANGHSEDDIKKWPIAKVRERERGGGGRGER